MSIPIQLEGNIKFGTTNPSTQYNSEITSLVINRNAAIITAPGTFANAVTDPNAGVETQTLAVNFLGDPLSAASFLNALWEAMETDEKILYWAATLNISTTVSATNPKYSGRIVVSDLDIGGAVGDLRQQQKTYPIKAGSLLRETTGSI